MAKRPKKKRSPAGRKTSFNDAIAARIMELAKSGQTDEQIADNIGVSVRTIYYWKSKNATFLQALKDSKDVADQLVEASLFQRAIGYSHPAVKHFMYQGDIETVEYVEHYPPSEVAAIFWLKNRQPAKWREKPPEDKPPTDTGSDEVIIEFQDEVPIKDA